MNNNKLINIIIVVTLISMILIFGGITYAYFTAFNNSGSTLQANVKAGNMLITYNDGTDNILPVNDIQPSSKILVDKTFSLTGTNTTSGLIMPFKIYLEYQNTFTNEELLYFFKRTDTSEKVVVHLYGHGEVSQDNIDNGYFPQELLGYYVNSIEDWSNNPYSQEIASGYFKTNSDGVTATFSLKMMFRDTGRNQDYNKGATFNGKIVVNNGTFTTAVDTVDRQLLTQNNTNFTTKIYKDSTVDKNVRFTRNSFLLNSTSTVSNNNVNYNVSDLNNNIENNSLDYNLLFAADYPSNIIKIFGQKGYILGIFNVKNADTGEYERMLKIVLDGSGVDVAFNSNEDNNWENSSLMKELNSDAILSEYYNYYKNKEIYQTSDTYDGVIANVEWDIGGLNDLNISLDTAYQMERGLGTYASNKKTWTGKIGLPSLSDLLYYRMKEGDCFSNLSLCYTDVYNTSWTLTKNNSSTSEMFVSSSQFKSSTVTSSDTSDSEPTFYLKPDIAFVCGDGSWDNPYAISKDECGNKK